MNIWDTLAVHHGEKFHELEKELVRTQSEFYDLRRSYETLERKVEEYEKRLENTPTDCKVGSWCKACEFGKAVYIRSRIYGDTDLYYCGKAEACQNFIQKKEI